MESYTEYVFERDLEKIAKEFSNSLKENGNLWYGEYSADKRKVFLEKIKSCYTKVVSTFKGKDFLGFKFKPLDTKVSSEEKSYIVDVYIKTEPIIFVLRIIFDTRPILFNQNHMVLFEKSRKSLYYDTEMYSFHTPDGREKLNNIEERKKELKTWKSKNHSFYNMLDQFEFEIQKGSWGPEDYIDARFIATHMCREKFSVNFYADDLYLDWQKTEFGKYFNEIQDDGGNNGDRDKFTKFRLHLTKSCFGYENNIVVFVADDEKTGRTYRFRFKFENGYGCLVCESGDEENQFSIVPIYYMPNGAYHVDNSILNSVRKDEATEEQVKKVLNYIKSLPTRFAYTLNKNTFGDCDDFIEEISCTEGDPIFCWTIRFTQFTVLISYLEENYRCNADSFVVSLEDNSQGFYVEEKDESMSLAKTREFLAQIKSLENNKFVLNKYFK